MLYLCDRRTRSASRMELRRLAIRIHRRQPQPMLLLRLDWRAYGVYGLAEPSRLTGEPVLGNPLRSAHRIYLAIIPKIVSDHRGSDSYAAVDVGIPVFERFSKTTRHTASLVVMDLVVPGKVLCGRADQPGGGFHR